MHPELEHAINTGLPISEVIEVFAKYHSGPIEEYIDGYFEDFKNMVHSDSSFWDKWKPRKMGQTLLWDKPWKALVPLLSIYKGLTREIISWLCDSKRRSNVYLIAEPQRAPYPIEIPTRASIIASICFSADRLGAQPYDFSLHAIIGQLAGRYPSYRRLVAKRLIDNPRILKLPTRALFKKLILDPWKVIQKSHPRYIAAPPVIVLHWKADYIDEDVFSSICEFSLLQPSSSLLWIISIDWNMKLPICDLTDLVPPFGFIRLPVCYDDGPSDAALILHVFIDFRQKYQEIFDGKEKWPSDEQMPHLIRIISGALESIDVIIDFVDRKDSGGPKAHLETFLAYMVDSPSPSDGQPYCALDHFYIQAFSKIPPHLLAVVNGALSIIYYTSDRLQMTPLQIACLLSIGKATVLSVHAYLSGWAFIGTETWYPARGSFRSFLKDPKRSGLVGHNISSGFTALESCLHFLSHSSNLLQFLKSRGQSSQVNPNAYIELENLRQTVSKMFCDPDTISRQAFLEHVLTLRFDFRCPAHTSDAINAVTFMSFLRELYEWDKVNSPNIIRLEPVGPLDKQFIDKCKGLAEPLDIENRERLSSPKYVLVGFDNETVLVLLEDAGISYKERRGVRVDIYTSAMLDLM